MVTSQQPLRLERSCDFSHNFFKPSFQIFLLGLVCLRQIMDSFIQPITVTWRWETPPSSCDHQDHCMFLRFGGPNLYFPLREYRISNHTWLGGKSQGAWEAVGLLLVSNAHHLRSSKIGGKRYPAKILYIIQHLRKSKMSRFLPRIITKSLLKEHKSFKKTTKTYMISHGWDEKVGKVYEKQGFLKRLLKYNVHLPWWLSCWYFQTSNISMYLYKYIYSIHVLYIYICIYIHLPAFHLSHPLLGPRYQDIGAVGTQCAVRRLKGLLETGETRNPRGFANLKLGGMFF